MEIKLDRKVCYAMNQVVLVSLGLDIEELKFISHLTVDLEEIGLEACVALAGALKPLVYEKGQKIKESEQSYKDVTTWIRIIKKGSVGNLKIGNAKTFTSVLKAVLTEIPGHRIFKRDDEQDNVWLCYYVSEIEYKPLEHHRGGGVTLPHTVLTTFSYVLGIIKEETFNLWENDIAGKNIYEGLLCNNFVIEDKENREQYLEEKEKFIDLVDKIGKQYTADGIAFDDVDGNDDDDDDNSWWRKYNSNRIFLSKDGEPSNVVIDVFKEKDSEKNKNSDKDDKVDWSFWGDMDDDGKSRKTKKPDDSKHGEIPVHPYLVCFDLKRQLRLRIHVNQLEKYVYDINLGEKLVIPKSHRALIEALLSAKGGFKDIIKGKGGGAVILCAGGPGLGKTLTAEVYAEVAKRPLYSVQCSQLGTDPDILEKNLMKIFFRAQRWKAILILDEADVYIYKRGKDMIQNAVVGVFLRTLEYYRGVMFMTTNRADLVDDAIASRCVALIRYKTPPIAHQKKLWQILSSNAGIEIEEKEVDAIVAKYSNLSGRDIKNLLKLSIMVASSREEKVTEKTISLVKRFKPTRDNEEETPLTQEEI